jgi:hypothetical protein
VARIGGGGGTMIGGSTTGALKDILLINNITKRFINARE